MKIREKNESLEEIITEFRTKGRQENVPLYSALSKKLNRPNRIGYEVNLFKLEKNAIDKGIIVVPGSVLGTGEISKALTVYALKFSKSAEEKIKKAGGKCLPIEDFFEQTIKGKRIMIMG